MRTNLPISQQGYTFPVDQTLVSVTDTKGRITYCNPAFVEVRGYTMAELLAYPHGAFTDARLVDKDNQSSLSLGFF